MDPADMGPLSNRDTITINSNYTGDPSLKGTDQAVVAPLAHGVKITVSGNDLIILYPHCDKKK